MGRVTVHRKPPEVRRRMGQGGDDLWYDPLGRIACGVHARVMPPRVMVFPFPGVLSPQRRFA
jgi:hypothetical protein